MEPEGLVSEASWSSFDAAMLADESETIAHLLGGHHFLNELHQDQRIEMPPILWPDHGADLYYCLDETNHNPYCYSQVTSSTSTSRFSLPLANNGGYYLSDSNAVPEIGGKEQIIARSLPPVSCHQFNEPIRVTEKTSSDQFGVSKEQSLVPVLPPPHNSQTIKKRIHVSDAEKLATNEKDGTSIISPKKKARASAPVPKKGENAQTKKVRRSASTGNEEDGNADFNGQSSSCYSSEDDSNASQELNGGGGASSSSKGATPRPSGKTRAGRQPATDPQSLYAKKRRERINKRLRILQNLVPNGTKVDISTMLEEAVQYVKFLQLQIKLLSSDDLWMYAPIAYNGINVGL